MRPLARRLFLVTILAAAPAWAQAPDTLHVEVPGIEVTALRGHDRVQDIPAATFVLSRETVRRYGTARIATLLGTLPGLYGYGQTSTGEPTVVDPRGFSASGESSYLKLLVNGQDVRDVENGNVDWDWISPEDVERVEIVQGPGAWAYGDGSEGGIVNIVQREAQHGFTPDAGFRGGSFGMRGGNVSMSGGDEMALGNLRGAYREVDGWRDRSRERVTNGGASVSRNLSNMALSIDAALLDTERDNPGTLTGDQLAQDRTQAESPADFDRAKRYIGSVRLSSSPDSARAWTLMPYLRAEDGDQVRTLFFQPLFHQTRDWTAGAEALWSSPFSLAGRSSVLQAMVQGEWAQLDSKYDEYTLGVGAGNRLTDGRSWRNAFAGSLGSRTELDSRTVARLSVRFDGVQVHTRDNIANTTSDRRTMSAVTPMLGLTRSLGDKASVYGNVASAFRVPTLFQLFDQRPIFVGPPPPVVLSNGQLDPQRSTSFEVGARHDGFLRGSAAIAFYSSWVHNEIDFDLNTLAYANINKSWHRGIEAQWAGPLVRGFTGRVSGAWTPTTFREGDNDGKQINGVPEGSGYAAIAWEPSTVGSLEIGTRVVGKQFMDKQEDHPLASYTVWEAAASGHMGPVRGTVRVLNLFDRDYSDTGFIGAFGEERFSPAAPRSVIVSLSYE